MPQPNVTTDELADCLSLLESEARAITAAELAGRLNLAGKRETRRRHVRAIIEQLRKNGSMIIADLQGGYQLTDDEKVYKEYMDKRQFGAKKVLGETHKRKKMLTEVGTGQGVLFGPLVTTGIG